MDNPSKSLLSDIDAFLAQTGMAPSKFGWKAVRDPNLLRNLRAGRELRSRTAQKVHEFMASQEESAA